MNTATNTYRILRLVSLFGANGYECESDMDIALDFVKIIFYYNEYKYILAKNYSLSVELE